MYSRVHTGRRNAYEKIGTACHASSNHLAMCTDSTVFESHTPSLIYIVYN